jgi:hypothetical protein
MEEDFKILATSISWLMEDDLNIRTYSGCLNVLANGRQPQYFDKLKMTSIFVNWKMTSNTY